MTTYACNMEDPDYPDNDGECWLDDAEHKSVRHAESWADILDAQALGYAVVDDDGDEALRLEFPNAPVDDTVHVFYWNDSENAEFRWTRYGRAFWRYLIPSDFQTRSEQEREKELADAMRSAAEAVLGAPPIPTPVQKDPLEEAMEALAKLSALTNLLAVVRSNDPVVMNVVQEANAVFKPFLARSA